MPERGPKPDAEDIDELGVRRSMRVVWIGASAFLVLGGLTSFLVSKQASPQPVRVHQGHSLWFVVLVVALAVVFFAAMVLTMVLWLRWFYRRPRYRRLMQYS